VERRFSVKIVQPRGARGWSVLATRGTGDHRRRRRYGRNAGVIDQASAWEAASRIRRSLEAGHWWEPNVNGALRAGDVTLTDAAQRFIDSLALRGKRPGTLRNYTAHLFHFGSWMRDEVGGSRTIEAFVALYAMHGDDALFEYVAHMRREKPGGLELTAGTAKGYSATAARWWTWCARKWRQVVPPAPEVFVPVVRERTLAPTWAQMDEVILATAKRDGKRLANERLRRTLWLCRCIGLRVSQSLRLRWSDFDFDAATVEIRPELGKTAAERTGRLIPVSRVLLNEMAGWGVREGEIVGWKYCNYVMLHDVLEDIDLPRELWERRSSHMFRKGFTTGLKSLGADSWAVERLTGHAVARGESAVTASYVDDRQLVDVLRKAVDLVPPVGGDALAAARAQRAAR